MQQQIFYSIDHDYFLPLHNLTISHKDEQYKTLTSNVLWKPVACDVFFLCLYQMSSNKNNAETPNSHGILVLSYLHQHCVVI